MADPATGTQNPPAEPTDPKTLEPPADPAPNPPANAGEPKNPQPSAGSEHDANTSENEDKENSQRIAKLEQELEEQKKQSEQQREALAERDRDSARKDVLLKHPELDEEDLKLCGETEPAKIGEWGDQYAERQKKHIETAQTGHHNLAVGLAREGSWSNKSPKTEPKGSGRSEAYEQAKKKYAHNNQ
ncbi:MAG: hypothetical protein J6575_03510 [Bifidobacterium sp.]|nr:hypothetical protein [Bifidobacterium sp.]